MFEHPGKQIIDFGKFFFWLTFISVIVCSFIIGFSLDYGLPGAIIACIIGCIIGWIWGLLNSLFIVAFGELVENSTIIREKMEEQEEQFEELTDEYYE